MNVNQLVLLEFDEKLNKIGDKKLSDGLSAVVHIGNDLWVANDESTSIERLTLLNNDYDDIVKYGQHKQFPIENYITLPLDSKNGIYLGEQLVNEASGAVGRTVRQSLYPVEPHNKSYRANQQGG